MFHFLTQRFDEGPQIIELVAVLRTPDGSQQLQVCYWSPLIPHQQRKKVEFGGSEVNNFTPPEKGTAIDIEYQVARSG
jgi:hypothetical protein